MGWQCRPSVSFLKIHITDQPVYIKPFLEKNVQKLSRAFRKQTRFSYRLLLCSRAVIPCIWKIDRKAKLLDFTALSFRPKTCMTAASDQKGNV